jgi:hypothetical protein
MDRTFPHLLLVIDSIVDESYPNHQYSLVPPPPGYSVAAVRGEAGHPPQFPGPGFPGPGPIPGGYAGPMPGAMPGPMPGPMPAYGPGGIPAPPPPPIPGVPANAYAYSGKLDKYHRKYRLLGYPF